MAYPTKSSLQCDTDLFDTQCLHRGDGHSVASWEPIRILRRSHSGRSRLSHILQCNEDLIDRLADACIKVCNGKQVRLIGVETHVTRLMLSPQYNLLEDVSDIRLSFHEVQQLTTQLDYRFRSILNPFHDKLGRQTRWQLARLLKIKVQ